MLRVEVEVEEAVLDNERGQSIDGVVTDDAHKESTDEDG